MNARATAGGLLLLSLLGCRPAPENLPKPEPGETAPAGSAAPSAQAPVAVEPPAAPFRPLRGVWVTRWDWQNAGDLERILERLEAMGANAVYFQVRGTADAYYRSSREPWAARLSGRLGGDPGFDPLAEVLAGARRRGLEVHAWLNTCTAWRAADPRPGLSKPVHPLRAHPEWLVRDAAARPYVDGHGYLYFDPAHPGFRRHLRQVVEELVSTYPLDGVHFDYFRYPAAGLPLAQETERLFEQARRQDPALTPDSWRRRRLVSLMASLHRLAHRLRPAIDVSAAVTGIYTNRWGWERVVSGLDDFLQDSHAFAEQGAVDTLIPMLYWPPTEPQGGRADFVTLARDFSPLAERVRLLAGMSLQYAGPPVLRHQWAAARELGFGGGVLFSYALAAERPPAELRTLWQEP